MGLADGIRKLKYRFYELVNRRYVLPAKDITIDVVIPFLNSDSKTLPLCIEGVRRCVNHKIGKIYIVSPSQDLPQELCGSDDIICVDESAVLGYGPDSVSFITDTGEDRSGWIFQQLIKLSGAIGENRYFLVIDADHILLRPHTFISADGRYVFYRSSAHHVPFYENMEYLTGVNNYGFFTFSYVTRKMIFDKVMLEKLRAALSEKNNKPWDKAIIDSLDSGELAPFSEFELYGNFIPDYMKISLPWRCKSLSSARLSSYENLAVRYGTRHLSLTFPETFN